MAYTTATTCLTAAYWVPSPNSQNRILRVRLRTYRERQCSIEPYAPAAYLYCLLKLKLHLLWSSAIALATAKTIIFCGCLKNFPLPDFSTFLNQNSRNFATWRGVSTEPVTRRTNEGQKPQILPISGPDRNKFSAAVPQWGGKSKI